MGLRGSRRQARPFRGRGETPSPRTARATRRALVRLRVHDGVSHGLGSTGGEPPPVRSAQGRGSHSISAKDTELVIAGAGGAVLLGTYSTRRSTASRRWVCRWSARWRWADGAGRSRSRRRTPLSRLPNTCPKRSNPRPERKVEFGSQFRRLPRTEWTPADAMDGCWGSRNLGRPGNLGPPRRAGLRLQDSNLRPGG